MNLGKKMYGLCGRLFPINRSLTGDGVRETLAILKEIVPELQVYEVECGTKVFDWTIPKEWKCREGYIITPDGEKIADFKENNLHILGYSTPVDREFSLEELKEHIYTLEDQPDIMPYVTSYYKERFGWSMPHNQFKELKEGKYRGYIDSELFDGSLTYGEIIIPGESEKEILISTYVCHPSMANNECSGPVVSIYLANYIKNMKKRRYTYRFVFAPETIGAITYLSRNLDILKKNVIAGFNLSCVGDDRDYSIIHSRYADTLADRVMMKVLQDKTESFTEYSYLKRGSDERQYQAPGVDIPLVGFCRSKYHEYPEYHTSADNMDVVSEDGFEGAFEIMKTCIGLLEANRVYKLNCLCEPQLGKRGLVPTISSKETYQQTLHLKDFIAYADGTNDLIGISDIIGAPIDEVIELSQKLKDVSLIAEPD